MVSAPLVWLCLACGGDPHAIVSQRIGDDEEPALHHAKKDEAGLAVVVAIIYEIDGKGIIEGFAGLLEAHAVLGEIPNRLCIIPFEIGRTYHITDYP
jgi:hypothetical protein